MARKVYNWDNNVQVYLDSLYTRGYDEYGNEVRMRKESPYFSASEDPYDPSIRRRIAEALGERDFNSSFEVPDFQEDHGMFGLGDMVPLALKFGGLAAGSGFLSNYMGGTLPTGGNMDFDLGDWQDFSDVGSGGELAPYPDGYSITNPGASPDIDFSQVGGEGGLNDIFNTGGFNPGSNSSNLWDLIKKYGPQVAKQLLGSGGASRAAGGRNGAGGYEFPWGDAVGSLVGYQQQEKLAKLFLDRMEKISRDADPFRDERLTKYQPMLPGTIKEFDDTVGKYRAGFDSEYGGFKGTFDNLLGKYTQVQDRFQDPNYWNEDSLLAGLNKNTINDTTRELAKQGYNMSGNVPVEVGQRLQRNNASYVPAFMNSYNEMARGNLGSVTNQANTMLGQYNTNANTQINAAGNKLGKIGAFAGADINPAAGAEVAARGMASYAPMMNAANGNLGNLFQSVVRGSQPSAADRLPEWLGGSGAQKNASLGDVFRNWSL